VYLEFLSLHEYDSYDLGMNWFWFNSVKSNQGTIQLCYLSGPREVCLVLENERREIINSHKNPGFLNLEITSELSKSRFPVKRS
jgi:hypothetical protein